MDSSFDSPRESTADERGHFSGRNRQSELCVGNPVAMIRPSLVQPGPWISPLNVVSIFCTLPVRGSITAADSNHESGESIEGRLYGICSPSGIKTARRSKRFSQ